MLFNLGNKKILLIISIMLLALYFIVQINLYFLDKSYGINVENMEKIKKSIDYLSKI